MSRIKFLFALLFCFILIAPAVSQEKKNGKVSVTLVDGSISSGKNKKGKRSGQWTTKSKDGTLQEVINYNRGVYEGPYIKYGPKGGVIKSGQYSNGAPHGTWYFFDNYGDTMRIETYNNGVLHGYTREGSVRSRYSTGRYVNGKKEGLWISEVNNARGKQIDSVYYINDSLNGVHTFYINGQLNQKNNYRSGKLHGRTYRYDINTHNLIVSEYYTNGKRDSMWYQYWPNGKSASVKWYEHDKPARYDSTWSAYRGDTLLQVQLFSAPGVMSYMQGNYKNGVAGFKEYKGEDGITDSVLRFYPNGALASRALAGKPPHEQNPGPTSRYEKVYAMNGTLASYGWHGRGGRTGTWVYNDSVSGRKRKEITYVKGAIQGTYRSYYPNGKIKVAGIVRYGYLSDSIHVYSAAGVLLKKESAQYKDVLTKDVEEKPTVPYRDPLEPVVSEQTQEGEYFDIVEAIDVAIPPDEEVLTSAEVMPTFPGDTLKNYLASHIQYPQAAIEADQEGTVYVEFIVEKDGSISHVKTAKDVPGAPLLGQEAVRVVRGMPRWNPGKTNGRNVRVRMVVPVRFKLN
jgi:TonB family protein